MIDNLPVATMARAGEGPIIAVDVSGSLDSGKSPSRPGLTRLGRPIRRALTGSELEIPRLGETIMRTVAVGSTDTVIAARLHADLVITPPVGGTGLMDGSSFRGCGRSGGTQPARRSSLRLRRSGSEAGMRPNPLTILAIAALGVFMAFVDATIVNIAFPDIGRSFPSVDISGLSWILNAYNIVFAAFLVAAGRLADLLGRKRVFLYGLVIFTASSVLCAVAPSAGSLVGFRILQALGAAALVPSSLGLILEAYPPERRSHAVALLTAVGAAAAGIGPALGGLLIAISSWRLVFLVNLPIGIAAFVLSRRHLGESRAPGRRRIPDLTGAMVFALAIAFLVLGVVKGAEWGWGSTMTLGSFVAAALLGALFTWRCKWHRSPIVDLSMLRVRTFTVANAMSILAAAGFYGYTLCNVLFLTGVWGYSVLATGLAITPGPFVAAAVAGPASRLAQRVGHRIVLVVGGLIWEAPCSGSSIGLVQPRTFSASGCRA